MKIGYRDWFAERCPQHCNIVFGWVAVGTAVAGAAGSALSAKSQNKASKRAAAAQKDASDQQIALIREQMEYAKGIAKPYQEAGAAADKRLTQLWNYDPGDPRAKAYGPYQPGGPHGGRPGMGSTPSVFQRGAPRDSVQAGGRQVAQVGARPRPPMPTAPPPKPVYKSPVPAGWAPSNGPIGTYVAPTPEQPIPTGPPNGGGGVDYGGRPPGSIGFEPILGSDEWAQRFANQQVR